MSIEPVAEVLLNSGGMVRSPEWLIVAEPDPARAAEYQHVLAGFDFDVVVVRNGSEIRPLLRRTPPPTLLVVNLLLPLVDGLSLCKQIAGSHPDLPVIAVTGVPRLRNAALEAGLARFAVLPTGFTAAEFEHAATNLLGRALVASEATERAHRSCESVQRLIQRLADDLIASFPPPAAIVGVTVAAQTWLAVSVRPFVRPIDPATAFLRWPLIRDAAETGDLVVVPDLLGIHELGNDTLPPAGTFRGVAVMPFTLRTGAGAGAACLLDVEPLAMDAVALRFFASRVQVAAAELERHVATEAAARQLEAALQELEAERTRASVQIAALSEMAIKDMQTGLLNRRGGREALARELARVQRGGSSSVLLADIDYFKRVNDEHGHNSGDKVISEVAKIFGRLQRTSDTAIRWGGEEFLFILPEVDIEGARRFGDRIREAVEQTDFGPVGRVTVSGGAAEILPTETAEQTVARADRALYVAKAAGRNRIQ